MECIKISTGVYFVQVPEEGLSILCGCPPDIVKSLMHRGLIVETSRGGKSFETGPNAILLSDVTVQGGVFCNMAEFPILQMFYRQGMILPGHPNNSGAKPIILGLQAQLQAQARYIFRGTFGLKDEAEMSEAGMKPQAAREILAFKTKFAGGSPRDPEEQMDFVAVDSGQVSIRGNLTIERQGLNRYLFRCGKSSVEVDLNLKPGETYEAPVPLDFHKIKLDYFSILHIGEGDGWDKGRPCMGSIVIFQGKFYLIDTGPNILNSLTALGISVNEIEGIFHSHAHDDHFAGLTSLVRTDHRIKYFASPLVRVSVMKKLASLMSLPEKSFSNSFEFHDLRFNKWNNIDGLEVMPVLSLHPVETNVFLFRTLWEGGYKTYAHLADIPSLSIMDDYLVNAPDSNELSSRIREDLAEAMFAPVQLKKVDSGGGLIHGNATDFKGDTSGKIILSHTSTEFTAAMKEIGSSATFGAQDVLIAANQDYQIRLARAYLSSHFPEASRYDLDMLLNCPTVQLNSGEFIARKGVPSRYMYMVINGVVEVIDSVLRIQRMVAAGTLISELAALTGGNPQATYRAKSYVSLLQVPSDLYLGFVERNFDLEQSVALCERTLFLQSTWLFGEMVSSTVHNRIARAARECKVKAGEQIGHEGDEKLYLMRSGSARLMFEDGEVDRIGPGDFFGEESVFFQRVSMMRAVAAEDSVLFVIPAQDLSGIPITAWKMLEVYERRLASFGSLFSHS
jgi:hemerythrin